MGANSRRAAAVALGIAALSVFGLAGCFGGGGGKDQIAFVSERDGHPEIYTVASGGGEPQRLTNSDRAAAPVWSPGRKRIAFLATHEGTTSLFTMEPDGDNQHRVVELAGISEYAWSPGGDKIAFVSDATGTALVYIADLGRATHFRLSTIDDPQQLGGWSPNGEWVVYAVLGGDKEGIHRKNPGGVDEVQLTERPDMAPRYSPDGKKIAFLSKRDSPDLEIYVMKADGSEEQNISKKVGDDWDFDWSPDSKRIVFVSERDGNPEIYTSDDQGEDVQRLTHNNSIESTPRFSPGGGKMVFASDSDGDFDIFTMKKDGATQRRLTATAFSDSAPDW